MYKALTIFIFLLQINSDYIIHLNINPEKDKEVNFLLSEIAKQVKYIKLETNEKCVIAWIKKLLIDGENVFIASHQGVVSRLFLFSSDGKFINEIGSPGRGPGEFSTVLDFTLNKVKRIIYILDTSGKIFLYDYSGKYLNTLKLDTRPTSILYSNEALFLFTAWPDYGFNKGYGIEIKQLAGNKKDIFLLNREQIKAPKQQQGVMVDHNYFYGVDKDGIICFLDAKFDTLYHIDPNYEIKPKMLINLIKKMPRDLFTVEESLEARKTHNLASRYIIAGNYIFFSLITADQISYSYRFNISSGELLKHNISKDKNYITNDFDGGLSFKPEGLADEGVLYSALDCDKLKEHLANSNQNKKPSKLIKTTDLLKLVQNSDYSDNPVIMFVILK